MSKDYLEPDTMTGQEVENQTGANMPALFWMMLLMLCLITAMAFYNHFVKGETQFVQFSIVFALLTSILVQSPALAKRRHLGLSLGILSAATSVVLLSIDIYLAVVG
jgi:hypothetical protein